MTRLRRILSTGRHFRRVSLGLGMPMWRSVPRLLHLVGPRKFSLSEVWSMALLDPALDAARLAAYVSKDMAWPLYERCNRTAGLELLNDKQLFHSACHRLGLPTLDYERIVDAEVLEALRHEAGLGDPAALGRQLAALPERFIVKPVTGYHGAGVEFFQRQGDQLFLLSGEAVDFPGFVGRLEAVSGAASVSARDTARHRQSVMFQKMGLAHPALVQLSGKEVMQSLRICTYLDEHGRADLLFGFLKVIAGESLIDNFQMGRTGNLIADVEGVSGRVIRALRFDPALGASRPVRRHPLTGETLTGFEVPDWPDACELALCAARSFPQTRAVGWDIGLTDAGPVLLEGNGTWDPVSPFYRALPVLAR